MAPGTPTGQGERSRWGGGWTVCLEELPAPRRRGRPGPPAPPGLALCLAARGQALGTACPRHEKPLEGQPNGRDSTGSVIEEQRDTARSLRSVECPSALESREAPTGHSVDALQKHGLGGGSRTPPTAGAHGREGPQRGKSVHTESELVATGGQGNGQRLTQTAFGAMQTFWN